MFQAKVKSETLKGIVDVVSTLVDEAKFNVNAKGVSLKAVDPAHVAATGHSRGGTMAATPVRETSTRPMGRISSTKSSILPGEPVNSKMKLSMVASITLALKVIRETTYSAARFAAPAAGW